MMSWIRVIGLRLAAFAKRRQLERDLRDELAYHLEQRQRHGATAPFGSPAAIQEDCRSEWGFRAIEDLWRELRQAARSLRRTPASSAAIVMVLAAGLGIAGAVFALVNALFLRDLPVRDPEQLVALETGWSTPMFESFRREQKSFVDVLAAGSLLGTVVTNEAGELIPGVTGGIASGNYFTLLGVNAAIGRVFTESDDRVNDPQPVMVITSRFRERQFAGEDVLGRKLRLFGVPFTIIGVLPASFFGEMPGRARDYWIPLNMQPVASPQGDLRYDAGYRWLSVMGRLHPGGSIEQAQAEINVVYRRLFSAGRARANDRSTAVRLEPARSGFGNLRRQIGSQLQILAGAAIIVLLIACSNAATLLLARANIRKREIAMRLALGCSRWHIARQLLLEGLTPAAAASVAGLWMAPLIAQGLLSLNPSFSRVVLDVSPDLRLIAFLAGLIVVVSVLCSLAPAVSAWRGERQEVIRSSSRQVTGSVSRHRAIRAVVALQTAFSVVLVASSFLFNRSLRELHSVEPGFDRDRIISATVNARLAGYHDDESQTQLGRRLVDRLAAIPGVSSASVALCAVLMGCSRMAPVAMEGSVFHPEDPQIWVSTVSPNYFQTTGMPIVMGRSFGPGDKRGSVRVAVVTESLARYYFPESSAVGKHYTEMRGGVPSEPIEIVGVVRDVRFVNPRDAPIRMAFLSTSQGASAFSYVQVRLAAGSPHALIPAIRRAMLEVEPKLFVMGPEPLTQVLDSILSREVALSRASGLFATLALLLACFGIYGAVTCLVSTRTSELGIRLALGARPRRIVSYIVVDALRVAMAGVALGTAAALAFSGFIRSFLFGVSATDPSTYLLVAAALLLVTALAALLPGWRASRIDPVNALRAE